MFCSPHMSATGADKRMRPNETKETPGWGRVLAELVRPFDPARSTKQARFPTHPYALIGVVQPAVT